MASTVAQSMLDAPSVATIVDQGTLAGNALVSGAGFTQAKAPEPKENPASKKLQAYFPQKASGSALNTLPLDSGEVLNLDGASSLLDSQVTAEMLQACVTRIRTLEAELAAAISGKRKMESSEPIGSAAKKSKTAAESTPASAGANGSVVVTTKQQDMIKKKMLTAAKQSLKGVKFFPGWDQTSREAKYSDLISKAEYDAVFNTGTLVQPTASNKPKSQVYIRTYNSAEAVAVLGKGVTTLKGELWQKGGAPSRGFGFFGGGGGFSKGKKLGSTELTITSMKVTYSAPSSSLNVVLSVTNNSSSGGGCGYDSDDY